MQTKDTDPTLAKLLEVDSTLAAQEVSLTTQLQEIQQKRTSLKSVVGMFMPETPDAPATEAPETITAPAVPEEMDLVQPLEPTPVSSVNSDDEVQEQATQPARARRTRAIAKRSRGKTRVATPGSGRGEAWRPYVREELSASTTLPELVVTVLQRSPGHVFEVPEIMNAIFIEDISKEAYKVARGRLLSVLSVGVKQNKWQRGEKGQYSSLP